MEAGATARTGRHRFTDLITTHQQLRSLHVVHVRFEQLNQMTMSLSCRRNITLGLIMSVNDNALPQCNARGALSNLSSFLFPFLLIAKL